MIEVFANYWWAYLLAGGIVAAGRILNLVDGGLLRGVKPIVYIPGLMLGAALIAATWPVLIARRLLKR